MLSVRLFSFAFLIGLLTVSGVHAATRSSETRLSNLLHVFDKAPGELCQIPCLPTPNNHFFDQEVTGFAARTRTNDEYGMPGWTRSLGSRFHKGVDILPIAYERKDATVRITYYDPKTGRDFSRNEPVLVPKDEIYSILDGTVMVANDDEKRSGYGRYLIIEHNFRDGSPFITMYAHLNRLEVEVGQRIRLGERIAWMGQTSSNAGGRNYLKAIPHMHFEIGRVINEHFANTIIAKSLNPKMLGGKYDPRNVQPYNPIEFLRVFRAEARASAKTD